MRPKRLALKAASFIAAAALLAAVPLSVPDSAFSTAPMTAYADESAGDLYYTVDGDHAVITGCNYTASSIEIPDSLGGYPVTAIGDYAFNGADLTSIKIPDTVTSIGNYAFSMTGLTSVTLPESLEYIGIRAFDLCSSLSEVSFPDHMIEIDAMTFDSTPWIKAQRQKDPLVVINGALIDGQAAKGDIEIPSSVKYVSPGAFERNDNITSVVFPSSVSVLNDSTFFYCSNLTSADLRYVTSIEGMSFAGCDKLTDLKVSKMLTSINYYAFADSTARATITVYGTKADWDSVEKNDEDVFLNNATYVFDDNFEIPGGDIVGDVNDDGAFNLADLVLFSKWLLGDPDAKLAKWQNVDLVHDEKLDAFDLCMMRKALIS